MLGTRKCLAFAFSVLVAATVRAQGYAVADSQALQAAVESDSRMWVDGVPGTNTCPAGTTPITQDECEAFAMMSTPMSFLSDTFGGAPFPTNDPFYPKGCSVMNLGTIKMFYYNLHPVGAPSMMPPVTPVCKDDTWVMYKSACPAGKVPISESECIDFAADKHHYDHMGSISSPGDPPGCFGRGRVPGPPSGTISSDVGKVFFNTFTTGSLTNVQAFTVCKEAPATTTTTTPYPATGSPTSSPTAPAAPTGGSTSAVGDPHMTTIYGNKFDIMRAGPHTLVHIPQGANAADTLLRVHAQVRHEGAKCSDMYIKVLNISGVWAEGRRHGGFSFVTESPMGGQMVAPLVGAAEWTSLGMVDLKVVRGTTGNGVLYLNMYARHLRSASKKYSIGGILGLDDYAEAATPEVGCEKKVLSLLSARERGAQAWA